MKTQVLLLSLICSFSVAAQQDVAIHVKESKQAIKQLATSLKKEMKSAMKSGGPIKAINVCNLKALPVTANVNDNFVGEISRTSLKVRNTANTPDDWELAALNKLESMRQSGKSAKEIAYSEVVDINGQPHFRMLKAIPTGKGCLACHGENITPEVKEQLNILYPADKATGFKVGDIRGAFSIIKKI